MKYLICIIALLNLNCVNKHELKPTKNIDQVIVSFNLKNSDLLTCEILNNTKDTLVTIIDPFYIEGNNTTSTHVWVWSKNKFSTPSIVYFQKLNEKINFDADGEYKIYFKDFPNLLVLTPFTKIRANLKLSKEFADLFSKADYKFFGGIVYAFKTELDNNVKITGTEVFERYQRKLTFSTELTIQPITFNILEKMLNNEQNNNDLEVTSLIWKNFINKASSENN